MDIATFLGSLIGFVLVLGAILIGGDISLFVNVPGLMIVMGGTFAAICVTFPIRDVVDAHKIALSMFMKKKGKVDDVVNVMVRIAEISRREGLLALENIQTDNPILKKACQLIADSADGQIIRDTLMIEISTMKRKHNIFIEVFQKLAGYAPAFGMIGTLIGLVQMLAKMDDPSTLGPAMAVAILTTFYGTIMANLVFLPFAGKMRARTSQEELHLQIIFEGAKSILENNNPRLVYEKLSSFIPPKERKSAR
ncbi:motility protein A [Desulfobaculum bizertense]|uniref:Chemotaxis protein MotA n=1 Tax=Desulfobaculum bizertense DSM 18034 TaxID=1121442 RepID=A0A1T4WA57_9BACT|nr:motility protein A [Desulfobaculum bizertense]UIJ39448.1 motility protein A [Desulfobaculum bizertense]SKA73591.1 chemotaxis protein MotA [Desulfobaculum bizertense DSM 18034]